MGTRFADSEYEVCWQWVRGLLTVSAMFADRGASDTNKFHEPLTWSHRMAKCWHKSACKCKTASNQSLEYAGCLLNTETDSYKIPQISTKAVVTKLLIWHSIIRYLKSLSAFKRKKHKCFCISYFVEWPNSLAWVISTANFQRTVYLFRSAFYQVVSIYLHRMRSFEVQWHH